MILVFVIIIAISLLYYLVKRLESDNLDTKMFKIGTGEEGGDFDIVGKFIEDNCKNIERIAQTSSDGGFNNLLKVNKGDLSFGICQERFFQNGYNNLLEFKSFPKLDNLRFISALYFESMNFIVKDYEVDSSGNAITSDTDIVINSINDLRYNAKIIIGVGESLSASQNNFEVLCQDYGIVSVDYNLRDDDKYKDIPDENKVYYLNGNFNDLCNKFVKGGIHGLFIMTGQNNVYIDNLVRIMNIKFIDFFDEESKIITNFSNYYFKKNINTANYFNEPQKQKVLPTLASRIVLFTNKNTPDSIVNHITSCVYEKHFALKNQLNVNIKSNNIDDYEPIELAYASPDFIIHPGAVQYYRSKNIISLNKKFEFDLEDYSKRVYKEYWKLDEIGNKQFNYSSLLDKSDENTNFQDIDTLCLE
jgi:TRAP transporter TAXI family solute receptor